MICTMRRRAAKARKKATNERSGATLVEMAVVLPVFFLFVFAFIEFGHVYLTIHVLNGAAKQASRIGIGDNSTTQSVKNKAEEVLAGLVSPTTHVTVQVLDGSVFDDPAVDPETVDYDQLPEIDLSEAESGQLFIVRLTVPYDNIAILGPKWINNLTITGLSVMRHE